MRKILCIQILLWVFAGAAIAQKKGDPVDLSGYVKDLEGNVLSGVSAILKDKPIGTTTNDKGYFELKAEIGDIIIFSSVGYKKVENYVAKSDKAMEIVLSLDTDIEEVVVTGLGGTQRKITMTGAVTTVEVKDLQTPATNLVNMLGGRVPGVISLQTSGEPGKNISEFWIRGIGTFGANSSALVLIDGLEGDLSTIDPADIESFSVLKDASATAVYGVRGANGVVLVTTKRGVAEKMNVSVRANTTFSQLNNMPKYLGAYDYALLANEAKLARGEEVLYTPLELDVIKYGLDPDLYPNVNWRNEVLKNLSQQNTLYASARGGGNLARYFLSLGTSNESAAYKNASDSKYFKDVHYNTYNFRANIDMNLSEASRLYFGVDGFLSNNTQPGMANTDYLWWAQSKLTPLTIPTRYSTGELPAYGPNDEYSPYVMLNYTGLVNSNTNRGNYTLSFDHDFSNYFIKGLKFRAQGAYQTAAEFAEIRSVMPDMYFASGRNANGELLLTRKINKAGTTYHETTNKQLRNYHFEGNLNYSTTIVDKHRISGLVYYYMSDNKASGETSGMAAIAKRYQGISSRISYSFDDTYMIDGNFGYTGSENFEPGKQFGFFPSVSGGWIPTNYKFMKESMPWFNFFKIRASYGLVGNDRISDARFPYLTIINENSGAGWGGIGGITESAIGADNLAWEKAKKFDLGIEGKFLEERLSFVVDFFSDQRDGIYQQRVQIPDYVGLIAMPFGNVGKMKSFGSDGSVSYYQRLNDDMSFTLRGNFTVSKNKVQNWEEAFPLYDYQKRTGLPHNIQRGYIALGLFKDELDIANSADQSGFGKYLPGDIKYKDINGDGKITSDDQVPISYSNYPRLMYGFGTEFTFKKLTIGLLFKGTGNTDFYHVGRGYDLGYIPFQGGKLGNVLTSVANQTNRWTPAEISGNPATENPDAKYPRLSYGNNNNNSQLSTFWKANSKYLRLQEINVNYNLATPFLKSKVGINSVDLQFVGSNLFVWDKIDMWDPEQAERNGLVYPIPRRFAFQLYFNL
ncbi:TonB-dependent receptor [Sphingobacterium sp. UT-1RO-CII-1]|uniref:SusC/RagA family TonB-linked outer membrane protein n=1 Tax=Sphingobacterium sp. UT-1RO-CII-1 TaxID=2995225 RepID=UPI00227A26D3|nr:TonB-dependent receptor [Sphingobacterium sp. UT-1RO-CII-1]MCY4778081.1 TonB-dependent receptor [Sphingobacterium sp. UT-1RO-CII-1]